jgi:hypothetical protein
MNVGDEEIRRDVGRGLFQRIARSIQVDCFVSLAMTVGKSPSLPASPGFAAYPSQII